MLNAHRLVKIVGLGRLSAGPQVPAAIAAVRLYAHAVQRLQAQRLDRESHPGTCNRRKELSAILIAQGFLIGLIHW